MKTMLYNILAVAGGSALGGVFRYFISLLGVSRPGFPFWTLSVNILGGFLIGYGAATLDTNSVRIKLLLLTGFCGGFTTFSAFSLETLEMFQEGASVLALLNIVANLVFAVGGCWLGYRLGL